MNEIATYLLQKKDELEQRIASLEAIVKVHNDILTKQQVEKNDTE